MNFYRIINSILACIMLVLTLALVGYHTVTGMCRTTGGTLCLIAVILILTVQYAVHAIYGKEE